MMRKVALVAFGGAAAASVIVLAQNRWDVNSIGVVRFGRAALTFGSIAADYKLNVYARQNLKDVNEIEESWSACHLRSAKRLLNLCEANGGVFIKVGQHLGAMEYILPTEYTKTLSILHNKAPTSSIEDVYLVIKEDLKKNKDELFCKFNTVPLGAASLAQVYKAELKTGETVAVKVQHRDVKRHSYVDMKTMEILVDLAAILFPDFKLKWLAEATKKNLPAELDFLQEGHNAEQISTIMERFEWLKIPKIYWKYCSERVLVMEFYEGGLVNDLKYMDAHGISPKDVAEKLGILYADMIFGHGHVHCDPHPGNVIVRKDAKGNLEMCLLDHGLYATLSNEFRYNYSQLWLSIINSDVVGMKTYGEALGVGELYGLFACIIAGRSWDSISNKEHGGILGKKVSLSEREHIKKSIANYLPQITQIFERVPRAMILVLKTNDLLRGVEHALKIQKSMTSFLTMSKSCIRAVYAERIRLCSTNLCRFTNHVGQQWALFRVRIFQVYLWLKSVLTHNPDGYY